MNSISNEGRRYCYICGGELIWANDYDSSDVHGWSEDDGGIVSIWYCSRCGREYCISDPDKETRIEEYNDYWQEDKQQ